MSRREKKSVVPLVALTIIAWVGVIGQIVLVDPAIVKDWPITNGYVSFLATVFAAMFFLFTLIFNKTRRGLLVAIGMTVLLILRLNRLGNVVNVGLVTGLLVGIDFYLANR